MANPFQGDDEDPFSGVRDEEGNIKREAPKKKERIVTKEELKKSGFTNLRDFLNAERGLKRRDGKAPSKTEAAKPEVKKERPGFFRRAVAALGGVKLPQDSGPDKEEKDEKPTTRPKPYSTAAAIASKNAGFKKGGSVSSASKRADGCAKKGKTKGRMV
jgi:hypothetical protein